tara:strand:- start:81 stop:1214 length:1134 start_codon:yes stop_codon:yes gene_type:complete
VSEVVDNTRRDFTIIKSDELHIAGYASIEIVDKQNDLITLKALREAVKKFMNQSNYRNVMTNHSNVQVGEVVKEYRDTSGKLWKTEVDDVGFFVVIKLRDDIEKAKEVVRDIRKGDLRSFSIGGQALEKMKREHAEHGEYNEISKLELHEVTICEKGINPEAKFDILKMDVENMTKLEKAIEELNELMKGDEMTDEYLDTETEEEVLEDVEMMDDEEMKAQPDLATGTLESGEAGEVVVEGGKPTPKHDQINVVKGFNVPTLNLAPDNLERAYAQFRAEQLEKTAYSSLQKEFTERFEAEINAKNAEIAKSEYDAQSEVNELKKQFSELLTHLQSEKDNTIAKQEQVVQEMSIPTSEDIAKMSWGQLDEEVKRLTGE